jgi:hypothetical protein
MQSIVITDPKEARRARFAQLRGEKVTLNFDGSTVRGLVRSVKDEKQAHRRVGSLLLWALLRR